MPTKHVVVLGAGVVGLTTAIKKYIQMFNHWAGAHQSFSSGDENRKKLALATYKRMWELSEPGSDSERCFLRVPQIEIAHRKPDPNPHLGTPNYQELDTSLLPTGSAWGCSFDTITFDVPVYLNYLSSLFVKNGGTFVKGEVGHIADVLEAGPSVYLSSGSNATSNPPDAVIVSVGLGARKLGGVEDKAVYPIRGQTIVVEAPWIKHCKTVEWADGFHSYIIPRRSGEVVIGGIFHPNDWYPKPRPEISKAMLERALAVIPELKNPDDPTTKLDIIYEGCGLRPVRKGGIRLEVEEFEIYSRAGKVPVVHHYGHGGAGYLLSWGSAAVAVELLGKALGLKDA